MVKTEKPSTTQAQKLSKKRSIELQSELEQLALHTIVMKLSEKESLAYFETHDHKIKSTKYYELKKSLKNGTEKQAHNIASFGLLEQHMKRINNLETIEFEQWECYKKEESENKKSQSLERIGNLQPYISAAYDATRKVSKLNQNPFNYRSL